MMADHPIITKDSEEANNQKTNEPSTSKDEMFLDAQNDTNSQAEISMDVSATCDENFCINEGDVQIDYTSETEVSEKLKSSQDGPSKSDEESHKKRKLNETTSSCSNSQDNQAGFDSKISQFRKLETNFRKRNYRSHSDAGEIEDDSNYPQVPVQNNEEQANVSESNASEPEDVGSIVVGTSSNNSSVHEDNCDSNDWSSASDDSVGMVQVLQKEPSKSNYCVTKELFNRQIGSNYSVPIRFYSSLHAVQRLELMYKLDEHLGCVNSLNFNHKGNLLVSASDDLTITIWDWAIGKKRITLQTGHKSNVFSSRWLPLDSENLLASCARDGQIRLIDLTTKTTKRLAQHSLACHRISCHTELPYNILSAGEDAKIFSIDIREPKRTKLLTVKENDQEMELHSIDCHPLNHNEFCVAGRMRTINVYDRRQPTRFVTKLCPLALNNDHLAQATCAVYNYNGAEIVASYNNEDIYLFDRNSDLGEFAHKYQGHRNNATIKGVNFFGPHSEFVISGSDCGNVFIWDKKTEAIVQWMPADEQGIVNSIVPHPHIPILATSGLDYDVKIWIPSREEAPNIKQLLNACVKKNLTARARNAGEVESAFDGQVLWMMLRYIHHSERRRLLLARRGNGNESGNLSNNASDYDVDNEDDENNDGMISSEFSISNSSESENEDSDS